MMSQILDPLPVTATDCLICCYVNATSQIQVVRITNIPNWYYERVVFPGQRLIFSAPSDAHLQVHAGSMGELDEVIPCRDLQLLGSATEEALVLS
ncbi:MAG: DUF1830 domain-containing protein [Gloeomargarita sp. SKYBB_i_bin120]|nr:DUF1830 domain-containing protein [Gloeomargarita sp. SKYB120]MDW8177440.1 DUF1830 domain-containing protein [Gloeomargarita sp. SKYBB_i_bin120]